MIYLISLFFKLTVHFLKKSNNVTTYNKNVDKSLLIEGWNDLRRFYGLKHDHCIYFGYLLPDHCFPREMQTFVY